MFGQGQQHRIVQHLKTQQVRVVGDGRFADQGDIQTTLTQAFELFGGATDVFFFGDGDGDVAAMSAVIPAAFWQAMREAKLVSERAPLPIIGG
jgi:hypothetical protein